MNDALSASDRRRLEALFDLAAELPKAEHASFVERECGANPVMRDELLRLLEGLMGEDTLQGLRPGAALGPGAQIGPYGLLAKIGEGGMGEVWAADQREPISRRVAIKLIKPGMDSTQVVARFEAERQALARMTHPNVAQVYGGGTTLDGRPYFAMEYVNGEPVNEYCDHHQLTTDQRLELFLKICAGVQHAHQKGLIHRDLKPSNLLVTEQDGIAMPKIIDFGVARATTGRLAENTLYTMAGQLVGTLDYMSPEQADPSGVDVDTRSDTYSLGVVLYQILSGGLPFEHLGKDVPLSAIQRAIREEDPPRPSTRVRAQEVRVAALHGTDVRSLRSQMSGDVDWICMKSLEKDANRRYQSASELADDLRRHLEHKPVHASPRGTLYHSMKFLRRHRVAVAAALLISAGLVAGVIGVVLGQIEADASAQRTRVQMPYADAYRLRLLEQSADKDLWPRQLRSLADVDAWIQAMDKWLPEARGLVAKLDWHRAELEKANTRSKPWTNQEEARHAALTNLVAGIETLNDETVGLLGTYGVSPSHGWSVPRRLRFAKDLRNGFDKNGKYTKAWKSIRPELQARYPKLELKTQIGLVPIEPRPESKLLEFSHLMTGKPARRNADGKIVLKEDTGVVLVLVRATDSFWMGTQSSDEHGHNFEPDPNPKQGSSNNRGPQIPSDRPLHKVALSAYFVSKYELTQGQWKRLTGQSPSRYGPTEDGGRWRTEWLASGKPPSRLHPLEQVSWLECMKWLPRVGLTLPSEAQWEQAARAGTETAWWPGPHAKDLQGCANLSDQYSVGHGGWEHAWPMSKFYDDSTMHARVDAYRPNPLGLYNVHGNVYEWCLDGYVRDYYRRPQRPDPVAPAIGDEPRVYRGGSYRSRAGAARSSARSYYPPAMRGHALGVRPAWVLPD